MTPKEYYNNQFRSDFSTFWNSLNRKGSLSRRRGSLLREGFNTLAPQSDENFSAWDFCIERRIDHLKDISQKNYFMFSVAYTILIDQVMYTHFKDAYPKFRELTMYPKMDSSAGWAGYISMANPFSIFNGDFIRTRNIDISLVEKEFEDYSIFILENLEDFFDKYGEQIGNVNWNEVKKAMINDKDINYNPMGKILYQKLVEIN
jgi:hypothetical protein